MILNSHTHKKRRNVNVYFLLFDSSHFALNHSTQTLSFLLLGNLVALGISESKKSNTSYVL